MKTILLDIRTDRCPMTYVKTRLELEKLKPNEQLLVMVSDKEPCHNIEKSAIQDGFTVIKAEKTKDNNYVLVIQK
jgi:tRNA 2-thiouridine synthesizing protein A